jgi:hypothetical protein
MTILLLLLGAAPPDAVSFDREIAPLLAYRCLDCHGAVAPEAKWDLSRKKSPRAMRRAIERVLDDEMPPGKPLPEAEKALLRRWLARGAEWGTDPIDPYAFTTPHRAGRDWWSIQPPRKVDVPVVSGANQPIDAFWLEQLKRVNIFSSAEADRRTLIRRVTYDLIGLPPTPEEIDAFVVDTRPDAYERVVDRLLASPHFGERWGRHWLDIARFGESDGFERDLPRFNAWPYRDWVIGALNSDLPYQQFARAQLIGDLQGEPAAAGFLVAGPHDIVQPVGEVMRSAMRQDELEDMAGTVSQVFLGLTFHCARCHDHKFDPISQRDYYRLAAALAGVGHGERTLVDPQRARLVQRGGEIGRQLAQLEQPYRERLLAEEKGDPLRPTLAWDFTQTLEETSGRFPGKLHGKAHRDAQGLHLDGRTAYLATPIKGQWKEKTLDVWMRLAHLDQRGGAALSIQTADGNVFDAVVFGEQQPGHWLAGSDFFRRTKPFAGPVETSTETLRITLTYASDGTVTAYRNGQIYGKSYRTTPVLFRDPVVLFGLRHSPAGGNKHLAGTLLRAQLFDRALSAAEVAGGRSVATEQILPLLSDTERSEHERLRRERLEVERELRERDSKPRKLYTVNPLAPGITHVLARGNVTAKGEPVAAEVPSVFSGLKPTGLKPDAPEADRRRALANWITDAQQPLFARVLVNRLWHHHFGRGIVDTPSDFGFSGGRPSHPELLDWLAAELSRQDGSMKAMHRMMVLSRVYRQSSAVRPDALAHDAENRFLWRKSPTRLEAETVRDAMLAVAGELDCRMGGPSYQDFKTYFFKGTQFYDALDDISRRRSVYRMWARGGRSPFLDTFDCPDPSTSTPRRAVTTTPLQALALLNNARVLRLSDILATRLKDHSDPVETAYRLAYGRVPTQRERTLLEPFVQKHGLAALVRVIFNSAEFMQVD